MYFKKSSNKDKKQEKDEVQNKEQIKKPEQVISPPYRFDGEINSQPIGLNQFLMNVNALESEPNSNHEIGREWMNSQHKYTQSYANILHNHPFLNQSVGSNPARNSWCMPKSNIESLPAANKDLNKMKHRELQYYEGSSDQSLKCVSDMSNDKSSQEIWQPKNQKQTRSPKPRDKLENKNFKDKESLIEEEEKVKNFEFQDVSANNSKDGIINNKESAKFRKYEELNMENIQSHLQKPFSVNHSQSNEDDSDYSSREYDENLKEREEGKSKKNSAPSIKNIFDLIENCVIPKWKDYMKSKAENHHLNLNKRPRGDTFRKKILRDMREFYRILFRKRFIVSEYKTFEGIKECMISLFDELGLPLDEEDQDNFELFKYIHQTHQHIRVKLKIDEKFQESCEIFQVIENYNEINFIKFLKHPLCSRMFYFVFKNYLHHYYPLIKDAEFRRENKRTKKSKKNIDYRKQVMTIIKLLLNCYKRMTKPEHMNRIDYLLN